MFQPFGGPAHRDYRQVRLSGHYQLMPFNEGPASRGARRGRYLVARTANGLETSRHAAAVSQRELGRQLGVSHTQIGRALRGEAGTLTIELAAGMASVLGLELNVTLHPSGDPVRDKGHLALLERFRKRLPGSIRWRTEVPIPIEGDRRSADAVIDTARWAAMVEAETRIDDVQALERKINQKQRDIGIGRVILLVADTRHNRSVFALVPSLRDRFPVSTRACLAALTVGRSPDGDALVIL
jgi:transcriptional regulator with XRE-family HTH domain